MKSATATTSKKKIPSVSRPLSSQTKSRRPQRPRRRALVIDAAQADKLKQTILELSRQAENVAFQSLLLETAGKIREQAFGYNEQVSRRKIVKVFREFTMLEIEDLLDETKLPKAEILKVINSLLAEGRIEIKQRRRWQEAGEHYSTVWVWLGDGGDTDTG